MRTVKGGHFLDAGDGIQHLGLMEYIASLSRADVKRPPGAGAETILAGETLMRPGDPAAKSRELL